MSEQPLSEGQIANVAVVVHRKPACHIELEVKAPPALVLAARKEALKKIGKEVSFPGFRKGHAPEEMVVKKYGSAIEGEWHKSIADAAFNSAQMQLRLPILPHTPVTFDLKKHSLEEGAELTFSFDTEPEIPTVDPRLFQLKPVKREEVGEKQIEEAIHQTRFYFAQWTPIVDRGVQENDYIIIDLETIEETPQKVFDQVRFQVVKERMAEWMKRLVIGAKTGAVLEGLSEPDEDASVEEKAQFQPKKIRLTLHQIEEAHLPEMEDFAHKMGVKDLPALHEAVKSALERNVEEKVQAQMREQVNEFLIDRYSFELPLSLIETEKSHRLKQLQNNPRYKESYDHMTLAEKKKVEEDVYTESVQAVRLFYLTRQIVREAKIPVTHEEVQEEAARSAGAFGGHVDPEHLSKEVFALALSKIILTKAQNYILENSSAPASTEEKSTLVSEVEGQQP
jgi:trigger factor